MNNPDYPIVQIAYFVEDIEATAHKMHAVFGAGPFYILRNIELASAKHRGVDCPFVHSSAYGQWGDIMLELVQQESVGPSPFRDLYAPGEEGIHHTATMVENLQSAYQHYEQLGYPLATQSVTQTGTEFAFMDATQSLGHFIEVYERTPQLEGFYTMVKQASENWRGAPLITEL